MSCSNSRYDYSINITLLLINNHNDYSINITELFDSNYLVDPITSCKPINYS